MNKKLYSFDVWPGFFGGTFKCWNIFFIKLCSEICGHNYIVKRILVEKKRIAFNLHQWEEFVGATVWVWMFKMFFAIYNTIQLWEFVLLKNVGQLAWHISDRLGLLQKITWRAQSPQHWSVTASWFDFTQTWLPVYCTFSPLTDLVCGCHNVTAGNQKP